MGSIIGAVVGLICIAFIAYRNAPKTVAALTLRTKKADVATTAVIDSLIASGGASEAEGPEERKRKFLNLGEDNDPNVFGMGFE